MRLAIGFASSLASCSLLSCAKAVEHQQDAKNPERVARKSSLPPQAIPPKNQNSSMIPWPYFACDDSHSPK